MKKFNKRAMSIASIAAILASIATMPVSAENVGLTYTEPAVISDSVEVTPRDNTYPELVWNLSSKGKYEFSGQSNGSAYLYTNYMFTGVDPIVIHVENKGSSAITVKVRKKGTIITTTVHTFTVPANSTKIETVNVNSNDYYYLAFSSPNNFTGYIF